jgi:hypothetical protein
VAHVVDLNKRPELLIIGGAPRSGKTLLARRMWLDHGIPSFTMDAAIASFVHFAPGSPINWHESQERAEAIGHTAAYIAQTGLVVHGQYLIEGESMTPWVVRAMGGAFTIHSVFLVLLKPRIDDIVQYEEQDGWVAQLSEADRQLTLDNLAKRSEWIVDECERAGLPYVDLSAGNFDDQMQRAQSILLAKETRAAMPKNRA